MSTPREVIIRLAVIAAMAGCGPPAHASPDSTASNTAPALTFDAPEHRQVAEEFVKARQVAETLRRDELRRLIQIQIDEAKALLAEKQKAGNVKGIAIATQARQMFESALTNLDATGTIVLTERVRRELEETVRHFDGVRAGIEARASNTVARIRKEHLERLTETLAPPRPDAQAPAIEAAFAALVKRLTAPPPVPRATLTNAVAIAKGTNDPAGTLTPTMTRAALPEVLGASGPADRWVTAGQVLVDMMSVDVLDIPLANQPAGTNRFEKSNPITDQSFTLHYVSIHPLPARAGLAYRLKRIPGREGVEILDWPGPRNAFTLTVRTMPPATVPCPHGFEVQVGGPDAMLATLFAGAQLESTADGAATQAIPVVVTIASKPSGAAVLLDGNPVRGAQTPCRLRVPPGAQSLRLVLPGYIDGVFSNQDITAGRPLSWTFQPDPRIVRKTVIVPADAADWIAVAEVEAGARIAIDARGTWSCAGGGATGVEGYPNNEANLRLYMNPADYPRHTPGANLGALLWRIAPRGRASAVGRALRITAPEAGTLQLDINEAPGPKHRADNTGALPVTLVILPPSAL